MHRPVVPVEPEVENEAVEADCGEESPPGGTEKGELIGAVAEVEGEDRSDEVDDDQADHEAADLFGAHVVSGMLPAL